MKKKTIDQVVQDGIEFLAQFLPKATYLYFPLLSAALVWAIDRNKEGKEKIFSWKVWADPSAVRVKSDKYIFSFFKKNIDLRRAYKKEIDDEDLTSLRKAFLSLYPILGLNDPFLSALFYQELEAKHYRKIVKEFKGRVAKAIRDIEAMDEKPRFVEGLKSVVKEMASLSSDMITQTTVQKSLAEIIKKEIKRKDD